MDKKKLKKEWLKEEKMAHIQGWDFSHIYGRYSEEENLPWDFRTVINKYLKNKNYILQQGVLTPCKKIYNYPTV